MKPKSIQSQIKSLETQIEVLKVKAKHAGEAAEEYGFASLCGILQGKSNSTFEEIKEAKYKLELNPDSENLAKDFSIFCTYGK